MQRILLRFFCALTVEVRTVACEVERVRAASTGSDADFGMGASRKKVSMRWENESARSAVNVDKSFDAKSAPQGKIE